MLKLPVRGDCLHGPRLQLILARTFGFRMHGKAMYCLSPDVAGVACDCARCIWGSGLNSAFGSSACFADFHIAAEVAAAGDVSPASHGAGSQTEGAMGAPLRSGVNRGGDGHLRC